MRSSPQTLMPSPATESMPPFWKCNGVGLVVREPAGGGAGRGALGGGAGGRPKSRFGKEDCAFKLLLTELREAGFVIAKVRLSSGSGIARSTSSSTVEVLKFNFLNSSIEDDCCCFANAATLLAEREGFMPRIGTVVADMCGFVVPVEFRVEVRKGA